MRTSWEQAKVEVPAERWADLSQDDYGVSLLNRSKYGYDIKGSTMRLSLLRSPKWPDPTADRGKHFIEYSLVPHKGRLDAGGISQAAAGYNNRLLPFTGTIHKGKLPTSYSFITLDPPSMILSSLKKAEASGSWIVQWYDAGGKATNAILKLPKAPSSVKYSSILEKDGEAVPFQGSVVVIPTKKNSMRTIKITY